jgi:hypothetical protein
VTLISPWNASINSYNFLLNWHGRWKFTFLLKDRSQK